MFAFDLETDPESVLLELAWAWAAPDRQQMCDLPGCPTTTGSYCLECHSEAHAAVFAYQRRFLAVGAS